MDAQSTCLYMDSMPAVSAIYYALLQNGYDFYALGRPAEHAAAIRRFAGSHVAQPFFAEARQNTCEVYPYWPRAALMETAALYLSTDLSTWVDYDALKRNVMAATNLMEQERNQAFWQWIEKFPSELQAVLNSPAFTAYMHWERSWLDAQRTKHAEEMGHIAEILRLCAERYGSSVRQVRVVLNPIKCVYSSDYELLNDCLIVCSGAFQAESIVHEYLHHILYPIVKIYKEALESNPREYPDLDDSYQQAGALYAFEEYAVRQLTQLALARKLPEDINAYIGSII